MGYVITTIAVDVVIIITTNTVVILIIFIISMSTRVYIFVQTEIPGGSSARSAVLDVVAQPKPRESIYIYKGRNIECKQVYVYI